MSFEVPNSTSPFWQKPGRFWELIPEVPYISYKEYDTLTRFAASDYSDLIKEVMNTKKETRNNAEFSQIMELAYIGLCWDTKHALAAKGKDIFLKLTKGAGCDWCELVNSFLISILDATTRTYVYLYSKPGIIREDDFNKVLCDICGYLQLQATLFIRDRNINPMGYYSFFYVNFKYYKSSVELDYHCDQNMPIAQFKDIMAAFAMGAHERLGEKSCVAVLDDELMRMVFRFEIFD